MTAPSIGRIVHVYGPAAQNNGAEVAPAIITRVWNDECVNVTVFGDARPPREATSVKFVGAVPADDPWSFTTNVAFWPPRV